MSQQSDAIKLKKIHLSASQFPVSSDSEKNLNYIFKHLKCASENGSELILFPESAITGYMGTDFSSFEQLDKNKIQELLEQISYYAKKYNIWVIAGAYFFQENNPRPFNCLYIISNQGKIVNRYDKRILYGNENKNCSYGEKILIQEINGIKCGFLICNDNTDIKLFEEYKDKIDILFHSLYNARSRNKDKKFLPDIIKSIAISASFYFDYHIVYTNSSAYYSRASASIITKNQSFKTLKRHKAGIISSTLYV